MCEHLSKLEQEIKQSGIKEIYRGKPWSNNCREWVYFDCVIDTDSVKKNMTLADCVQVHTNHDPKSGREHGLVCTECHDAVMGYYIDDQKGRSTFKSDK